MIALIVLLAAAAYFGQRWRVDAYRAWVQSQRTNYGHAAVTTRRPEER